MMDMWTDFEESDAEQTAQRWVNNIGTDQWEGTPGDDLNLRVVVMSLRSPVHVQKHFLMAALTYAENDEQLGFIAAYVAEPLMSKHGATCITWFESMAELNVKFSRMTTGMYQHLIDEDIWERIGQIKARVEHPIALSP